MILIIPELQTFLQGHSQQHQDPPSSPVDQNASLPCDLLLDQPVEAHNKMGSNLKKNIIKKLSHMYRNKR